jgi:hypothetical protein
MGTNGHLDLDTGGKSVDQKVYQSMIGSLFYLCASRPDIMLFVCMCARFLANPTEVHLRAVNVTKHLKVLGPPTVVLVLRTLDSPVDAPNHLTSSVTVSSSFRPRALHPSHIYYITSEERISVSRLQ